MTEAMCLATILAQKNLDEGLVSKMDNVHSEKPSATEKADAHHPD